jgi:hypothetical protein
MTLIKNEKTCAKAKLGRMPPTLLTTNQLNEFVRDGEQNVDLRYTIDGYPVAIYTLNLGQPWFQIEKDLLNPVALQGTKRPKDVRK